MYLKAKIKLTFEIEDDDQPTQVDFIKGIVWEDHNSNGQVDEGEQGISGLQVYIDENANSKYDIGELQVQTDSSGKYLFEDLVTGAYSIGISNSFGYNYTFPSETASSAIATRASGTIDQSEIPTSGYFQDVTAGNTTLRPDLDTLYENLDGSAQTVVVIDSGIDTNHPFFGGDTNSDGVSDRIIFSKTFGSGIKNGEDVSGHGTHVSGIIASSDAAYSGVAPGADIIALKIFDSPGGHVEDALAWCVANADRYSIDVINMSLSVGGSVRFQTDKSRILDYFGLDDELTALTEMGVVCVASAGNSYVGYHTGDWIFKDNLVVEENGSEVRVDKDVSGTQGVAAPGAYSNVLSVGATWASVGGWHSMDGQNPDSLTLFSQRDDELLDLVAYGGGRHIGSDWGKHGSKKWHKHVCTLRIRIGPSDAASCRTGIRT